MLRYNAKDGTYSLRGRYTQAQILELAEVVATSRVVGEPIGSPSDVRDFLRRRLAHQEHEQFHVMFLSARHTVLESRTLFNGSLTGCAVYVGEVCKAALKANAAAMVIAHNHPSGIAEPSAADREITERLRQALALLDIMLLDHVVVGGTETVSFAERGWL